MQLSNKGIDFIKKWESFSAKAFWDYKQWSIGYGTKALNKDEVITEAEAVKRLYAETQKAQENIKAHVKVPLTQSMFDALVSFTYNVGPGWLTKSSLVSNLNNKNYSGAADILLLYNRAGGKRLTGLVSRRKAERQLFLIDGILS